MLISNSTTPDLKDYPDLKHIKIVRDVGSPSIDWMAHLCLYALPLGGVIAGGSVRDLVNGGDERDIDLFYPVPEACGSILSELIGTFHYVLRGSTSNTKLLQHDTELPIHLCYWVFETVADLVSGFDFVGIQACIWQVTQEDNRWVFDIIAHKDFEQTALQRKIVLAKDIMNPSSTAVRALALVERGFKIVPGVAKRLKEELLKAKDEIRNRKNNGEDPSG